MKLNELSNSEKIFLAEQLWESVRADAHPVSLAQKIELDARLASYELDKDAGEPWDQVKERILSA